MSELDLWLWFRQNEIVDWTKPRCFHCNNECDGDVSEIIDNKEYPICEDCIE